MILYNPYSDELAIADMEYGLYWNLEFPDKEILFCSASPFTYGWVKIGVL